jgi:hypothetical protein
MFRLIALPRSLRLAAKRLIPVNRARFSQVDGDNNAEENFDFDEVDDEKDLLEQDILKEEEFIKKELEGIADPVDLRSLLMVKNASPLEFVRFIEQFGDQINRKSFPLILKNMISCLYNSSPNEAFLFIENRKSLAFINMMKDQILLDCRDNELVDLLALNSALKRRIANFSKFLNINSDTNQKLTQEIRQRINGKQYDLRSLIRICRSSDYLRMNYISQPALLQISVLINDSPDQLNMLEAYIICQLMEVVERAIDTHFAAEGILRQIFKGRNRLWTSFSFHEKLHILRRICNSKILNRNLMTDICRVLVASILSLKHDPSKLTDKDISNGLFYILNSNYDISFPDFHELILNALLHDLKDNKEIVAKHYFKELLEVAFVYLQDETKESPIKNFVPCIKAYFQLPFGKDNLLRHWGPIIKTLNNILIVNSSPETMVFFKPLVLNCLSVVLRTGKALALLQFLPKAEMIDWILAADAEFPHLMSRQSYVINFLNFAYELGLENKLQSIELSQELDTKVIFMMRLSPRVLTYFENNFDKVESSKPNSLFALLNESYNLPSQFKSFYDKVLGVFTEQIARSLRGADGRVPIYPHTPLVLLDILMKSFPVYQVQSCAMVFDWITESFILRYQLSNIQNDLINKLTEIIESAVENGDIDQLRLNNFTVHLFNHCLVNYFMLHSYFYKSNRLIAAYCKFNEQSNNTIPIGVLATLAEKYLPFDYNLLMKKQSNFSYNENIHHIAFLYPTILQAFPHAKKIFNYVKSIAYKRWSLGEIKKREYNDLLKFSESRQEAVDCFKKLVPFIHTPTLKMITVFNMLIFEQRFGGVIAQISASIENDRIRNPHDFLRLARIATNFLDVDNLSTEAVKFIRSIALNTSLVPNRFKNNCFVEAIPFMRTFCIVEDKLIDFRIFNYFHSQHIEFFYSAAMLFDHKAEIVFLINERLWSRNIFLNYVWAMKSLLIFFHAGKLTQEVISNMLKRLRPSSTKLTDFYEKRLIEYLIDTFHPELKSDLEQIFIKIKWPSPYKLNSIDLSCRSFKLVSKHAVCKSYMRGALSLQAYELPEQGIVVVESTAGADKYDFLCQSAIRLIEVHSPEAKIVVVDLVKWTESSEAEKLSYLESKGITLK